MVDYVIMCPDFRRVVDISEKMIRRLSANPGNVWRGWRAESYITYEVRSFETGKWTTVRIATPRANNQGLRASIYTADEAEAILDREDISR